MTLPGSRTRGLAAREFEASAVLDAHGDALLGEALASLVREGLCRQGRVSLRLRGHSMWPTVPVGSLVAVEQIAPEEIRLGDVVIWQERGQLIAHRVVQKVRDDSGLWLVTKGDNNAAADQRLAPSAVLGCLVAVCGSDGVPVARSEWGRVLEAAFWASRWRLRRLAGRAGRWLPAGLGRPLVRVWDGLGHCLSLAFKVALLRY